MRRRHPAALALLTLLAAAAGPLRAQPVPVVEPGAHVRVLLRGGRTVEGTFARAAADSIYLESRYGGTVAFARPIRDLHLGTPVGNRAVAGLLKGFTYGTLLGLAAGFVAGGSFSEGDDLMMLGFTSGVGALSGMLIGTVAGARSTRYEWTPVDLPATARLHADSQGGVGLALRVPLGAPVALQR